MLENGFVLFVVLKLIGIEVYGLIMYFNFVLVEFILCKCVVDEFLVWLKKYKLLLFVVYNVKFDVCILVFIMCRFKMDDYFKDIVGFSDLMYFFKKEYLGRGFYKLESLLIDLME